MTIRTLAAFLLLAGTSSAQLSDRSNMHPGVPPREAGTLDWATGAWRRPGVGPSFAGAGTSFGIYDNTCTWDQGLFSIDSETCWERYDDGRIPTTVDPNVPSGPLACDCYIVCGFEIAYCTSEAPGTVDVQIGFYEGLVTSGVGGFCAGYQTTGAPPSGLGLAKPPGNLLGPRDFYIDLTGVGLPADPLGGGNLTCWVVTVDLSNNPNGGFSFCGNDDVVFDNFGDRDLFNWVWQQDGTARVFGPTGPFLAGEPLTSSPGGNTFNINAGTDVNTGRPCGTGLGNGDNFWVNVDAQPIGGGGNPASCVQQPFGGSNCYFMGGWPSNPWAGMYMRMTANGTVCSPDDPLDNPLVYCTPKASSSGCLATIAGSTPFAQPVSGADDYDVVTTNVQGLRAGIFFYGISGPANLPFQGTGTLCVNPQLIRAPIQFSQGSQGNCDGSFLMRINDGTKFNLDLGPGTTNWIQTWYRDPLLNDGFDSALSNAIEVTFQ